MAKGNPNPSPQTRFQPGHALSRRHGGESAVKAIQKGEPLTGPAREAELAVHAELETRGRYHLVKRTASRLQAACDLYWSAISKLMEMIPEGGEKPPADVVIVKLDRYVARFGWLAGASLRAWAQVREEEKSGGGSMVVDYEEVLSEAD